MLRLTRTAAFVVAAHGCVAAAPVESSTASLTPYLGDWALTDELLAGDEIVGEREVEWVPFADGPIEALPTEPAGLQAWLEADPVALFGADPGPIALVGAGADAPPPDVHPCWLLPEAARQRQCFSLVARRCQGDDPRCPATIAAGLVGQSPDGPRIAVAIDAAGVAMLARSTKVAPTARLWRFLKSPQGATLLIFVDFASVIWERQHPDRTPSPPICESMPVIAPAYSTAMQPGSETYGVSILACVDRQGRLKTSYDPIVSRVAELKVSVLVVGERNVLHRDDAGRVTVLSPTSPPLRTVLRPRRDAFQTVLLSPEGAPPANTGLRYFLE